MGISRAGRGQLLYKVKLTCVFACMVVSMRTKPSDFCLAARSSQDLQIQIWGFSK